MKAKRSPYLDILRIFAMSVVFLGHSSVFSTNWGGFFGIRYTVGELGVTTFFVLSGYLLGASFFRKPEGFSVPSFYLNRLLRLLPVYYFSLLFTAWLNHNQVPVLSWFLLQNRDPSQLSFMPPTWSLCIEEWCYVFMMVAFLILMIFFRKNRERAFLAAVVLAGITALIVRIITVARDPGIDYDYGLRKQTLLRMDTFALGILGAYLEIRKPELFGKLKKNPLVLVLAILGLAGSLVVWYKLMAGSQNPAAKCLIYLTLPLSVLYFILKWKDLNFWEKKGWQKAAKPLAFFSALTYPCYLIHFQYFILVSNYCNDNLVWQRTGPFLLTLAMVFGWALAVHFVIEVPINVLRKKLVAKFHM